VRNVETHGTPVFVGTWYAFHGFPWWVKFATSNHLQGRRWIFLTISKDERVRWLTLRKSPSPTSFFRHGFRYGEVIFE
jgi:hypothetical protein